MLVRLPLLVMLSELKVRYYVLACDLSVGVLKHFFTYQYILSSFVHFSLKFIFKYLLTLGSRY